MYMVKVIFFMKTEASENISRKEKTEAGIWKIIITWTWFGLVCSEYKNILLLILLVPVYNKHPIYICLFFF